MKEFILPYWRPLTLILVLGTIATLSGLAQPYFTKILIDDVLLGRNFRLLLTVSGGMLGVTLLSFALNSWTSYRYIQVSAAILFDMRRAVYAHLQRLSPRFYAATRLGDIVSRLNNDVGEIQRISADTLLALTTNVLFLAGTVAILLYLDAWLSFLTFVLLPLTVWSLVRVRRRLESDSEAVRRRSSELGSFLVETLLGIQTTVLMAREQRELNRFREHNDRLVRSLLRRQTTSIIAGLIPSLGLILGTLLVFVVGGYQVIDGAMTLGSFVAFMAYQARLVAPVQNIMTLYTGLAVLKVSVKRVMELLDAKPDVTDGPESLEGRAGAIEFRHVTFRHDRDDVLEDASFVIPEGSLCVVLGSSGAGKSSIADLLTRLLDPESGTVLIGGRDLRQFKLSDIRRAIALVEQDAFLFNATIEDNVRYGGGYVHDNLLPLPPATPVGERGQALSGGEKQCVGIARALARQPQVLILDEATSAMDAELEAKTLREVRAAMTRGTIVLITHRAYLSDLADVVLHVEGGKVVVEECSKSR